MNHNIKSIEFAIASEVRVNAEGQATFSIRAVARLANVSHTSLSRAFLTGALQPSELATFLYGHGFDSGALEGFSKSGIPDLAAASIIEYYAFEAGWRCQVQALYVHRTFARAGIRLYAHQLAGWHKVEQSYEVALQKLLEAQLPTKALPRQTRFDQRFWDALEKVYGLKRSQRACANFINCRIYGHFPIEVRERMEIINPLLANGISRAARMHQHFDETLLQLLQDRITQVTLLLEFSDTRQEFKRKIKKIRPIRFNANNVKVLKGVE